MKLSLLCCFGQCVLLFGLVLGLDSSSGQHIDEIISENFENNRDNSSIQKRSLDTTQDRNDETNLETMEVQESKIEENSNESQDSVFQDLIGDQTESSSDFYESIADNNEKNENLATDGDLEDRSFQARASGIIEKLAPQGIHSDTTIMNRFGFNLDVNSSPDDLVQPHQHDSCSECGKKKSQSFGFLSKLFDEGSSMSGFDIQVTSKPESYFESQPNLHSDSSLDQSIDFGSHFQEPVQDFLFSKPNFQIGRDVAPKIVPNSKPKSLKLKTDNDFFSQIDTQDFLFNKPIFQIGRDVTPKIVPNSKPKSLKLETDNDFFSQIDTQDFLFNKPNFQIDRDVTPKIVPNSKPKSLKLETDNDFFSQIDTQDFLFSKPNFQIGPDVTPKIVPNSKPKSLKLETDNDFFSQMDTNFWNIFNQAPKERKRVNGWEEVLAPKPQCPCRNGGDNCFHVSRGIERDFSDEVNLVNIPVNLVKFFFQFVTKPVDFIFEIFGILRNFVTVLAKLLTLFLDSPHRFYQNLPKFAKISSNTFFEITTKLLGNNFNGFRTQIYNFLMELNDLLKVEIDHRKIMEVRSPNGLIRGLIVSLVEILLEVLKILGATISKIIATLNELQPKSVFEVFRILMSFKISAFFKFLGNLGKFLFRNLFNHLNMFRMIIIEFFLKFLRIMKVPENTLRIVVTPFKQFSFFPALFKVLHNLIVFNIVPVPKIISPIINFALNGFSEISKLPKLLFLFIPKLILNMASLIPSLSRFFPDIKILEEVIVSLIPKNLHLPFLNFLKIMQTLFSFISRIPQIHWNPQLLLPNIIGMFKILGPLLPKNFNFASIIPIFSLIRILLYPIRNILKIPHNLKEFLQILLKLLLRSIFFLPQIIIRILQFPIRAIFIIPRLIFSLLSPSVPCHSHALCRGLLPNILLLIKILLSPLSWFRAFASFLKFLLRQLHLPGLVRILGSFSRFLPNLIFNFHRTIFRIFLLFIRLLRLPFSLLRNVLQLILTPFRLIILRILRPYLWVISKFLKVLLPDLNICAILGHIVTILTKAKSFVHCG